jgi:hypothetical protein
LNLKYRNKSDCMKKKIYLLFLSTLPILTMISINYIDYAHGQLNQTQALTIQSNPGVVEFQPPVDSNTGQTIKLPGTLIGVKDPVTGQIIARDVKFVPPEVTGSSITKTNSTSTLDNSPGSLSTNLPALPIRNIGSALGLNPSEQNNNMLSSTSKPELTSNFDNTDAAQIRTSNPSQNDVGLFSQINPKLTPNIGTPGTAAPGPTYNPPLMECNTVASGTEGGFDIAKYVVTGKFNKDMLKGDDFTFQIFSDLVEGDETEITGDDTPYKASILTNNNGKSPVEIYEIATVCIDTQHVANLDNKATIELDNSDLFKSLEY